MIRRTALYEEHLALNGRMVDFAGWELPVMYSSILEEHTATRTKAGLFDVSHMGEVIVRGAGAERFLRRMIPTRIEKLSPRRSMYSCLCREDGGVVDDIFIFMNSTSDYYIVANAATLEKDLEWMRATPEGTSRYSTFRRKPPKLTCRAPPRAISS